MNSNPHPASPKFAEVREFMGGETCPMNQMNQMNLIPKDWDEHLHLHGAKGQLKALHAENTIFCAFLGSESGSLMFIWFIGLLMMVVYSFFNEPNVLECRKGNGMGNFALSDFWQKRGPILTVFEMKKRVLNELESGPMYIKFIGSSFGAKGAYGNEDFVRETLVEGVLAALAGDKRAAGAEGAAYQNARNGQDRFAMEGGL